MENDFKKLSIIIPVWKGQDFIEECLDSIYAQPEIKKNKIEYEVLIGIDACEESKNKLLEIKDNYKNLFIFYNEKNTGPYIIRNTLAYISSGSHLLFFDADDVLFKNVFKYIIEQNDYLKLFFRCFSENIKKLRNDKKIAEGVFYISKKIFYSAGGFYNFKCGADTEFHNRTEKNQLSFNKINQIFFARRQHINSQTNNSETGMLSKYRQKIKKFIYSLLNSENYELYVSPVLCTMKKLKEK